LREERVGRAVPELAHRACRRRVARSARWAGGSRTGRASALVDSAAAVLTAARTRVVAVRPGRRDLGPISLRAARERRPPRSSVLWAVPRSRVARGSVHGLGVTIWMDARCVTV
jgi:hypothetical protein